MKNLKTYLITGSTGLIGSELVRSLLSNEPSCRLVLPVRNLAKAESMFGVLPQIDYVQVDFADYSSLQVEGPIDYIIHCACPTSSKFMIEHPIETVDSIVNGTKIVLELAQQKQVKSVVYLSSLEVYGTVTDDSQPITEIEQGTFNPLTPRSCYPFGKSIAEYLCRLYYLEYNVSVKIVRLTQTFGPGVNPSSDNRVFAQFARCLDNGEDIIIKTKGESKKMYLHTSDAVSAILCVLEKGQNGEVYNAANPQTYISIKDMAEYVVKTFNPSIQVLIENKQCAEYPAESKLRLSTEKLYALGWRPRYGLKEMFEAIISNK